MKRSSWRGKFSGEESAPFVNGVLDSVRKELKLKRREARHFPMQKVEKMRLRISSAVVAPGDGVDRP